MSAAVSTVAGSGKVTNSSTSVSASASASSSSSVQYTDWNVNYDAKCGPNVKIFLLGDDGCGKTTFARIVRHRYGNSGTGSTTNPLPFDVLYGAADRYKSASGGFLVERDYNDPFADPPFMAPVRIIHLATTVAPPPPLPPTAASGPAASAATATASTTAAATASASSSTTAIPSSILAELWDSHHKGEYYNRLRPLSYFNTDCVILCFSVVNRYTFESISETYVRECGGFPPECGRILVGCQTDLRADSKLLSTPEVKYDTSQRPRSVVTHSEGQVLAAKLGCVYFECSGTDPDSVCRVYYRAVEYGESARANRLRRQKKSSNCIIA